VGGALPGERLLGLGPQRLASGASLLVAKGDGRRLVGRGAVLLVEAADGLAGEHVGREGELVHPGQDNVLCGLGDEHPQHGQDARHPQLDRGYRHLQGNRGGLAFTGEHLDDRQDALDGEWLSQ